MPPAASIFSRAETLNACARTVSFFEISPFAGAPRVFVGLVTPTERERELNGPRRERRPPLDLESQVKVALEAIRKRRVILLFNGVQVEDIDAPLVITPVSEARFLRLVPLAGG